MRGYVKKNRIFVETFDKTKRISSNALIGERRSVVDFQFIHFFYRNNVEKSEKTKPEDNAFNIRYFPYRLEKVQSNRVSVAIEQFFTSKIDLKKVFKHVSISCLP